MLLSVQARWEHLNRGTSWLTEIQAIAIDGHFAIEQQARCFGNFAFNFNGTAGVWRRAAIEDAGGWQDTTLTEDLDLSYRAWLKNWRGLYQTQVAAPAELPPTMTAFRRQQARWAQGSIESARLLLVPIWRSDYPLFVKLQATIHLLGYLVNPIMAILVICYPLILPMKAYPPADEMFALFSSLGPLTLAPTIFFIVSQMMLSRGFRSVLSVLLFQVISAGLAMNTMRATLKALFNQRGEFLRTPKWGATAQPSQRKASSSEAAAYRVRADVGVLTDLVWGLLCLLLVIVSIGSGHIFITAYTSISCAGALWIGLWTLWPELRGMFYRAPRPLLSTSKVSS
ncbi:MAG: glycosyltransferase family 2 protein [Anaerolineae bacterium]